jgi:hypothetical protein
VDAGKQPTHTSDGIDGSSRTASHEPRTQPRSALRTESISDLKHPPGASTYRLRLTERYRSVDPFQRKSRLVPEVPEHSPGLFGPRSAVDLAYSPAYSPYSLPLPVVRRRLIPRSTIINAAYLFLFDSTPRELYLSFLFRLPSLYFARVARVFEDAELSKPDIKKMVSATAQEWEGPRVPSGWNWNNESARLPPALLTFRRSWEEFIDSLMTEWKTLNLVSVLLLSCVHFHAFAFPRFSDWHTALSSPSSRYKGRATTQSHARPPSYPSSAHSPVSHMVAYSSYASEQ